ncbi:MDR family MFS transporter [Clostridium oryzae]|uniref:Antiseptic resistance protein n=1 Tax=Clostridium oryzae TaxID=1450648 RepID=A0A1V4IY37_9CLOT|nr:MDR family MFS transporter [Clostridium oryzae]OPJ64803.1 antiseptic resistance protein [Clostridium oryzae]
MEVKKIYFQGEKQHNTKAMMAVLLFAGFLSLFNETILNVALPRLMSEMQVTAATVQWLATGYMLIVGILVPVTAFLIHTFTTKQLFLSAMILFLLGSILAVLSRSFQFLLASRMIQATGTGMLVPIMMNTVLSINPPEKRGSAMGLCVCAILFGPALGPIVSGILLQFFNWQSLFLILIPLSIICIITGTLFLENVSLITKPQIDYLSILLSTIGFGGIIYGISIVGDLGRNVINIVLFFVIGIVALVIFSKRQLSLKQPILEIRAFKHPLFSIGVILIILMQMIQFSMNIILPMLLQEGLKTSSLVSALALFQAALLNGLMTPITGKIYDKIGGKVLIPSGLLLMCIFIALLSHIGVSTSIVTITILYCFVCLGIAMSMSTTQTNALNQLSMKNQADGVAITNTSMQIGAAIGSPLFMGLMSAGQNSYLKNAGDALNTRIQTQAIYNGFSHALFAATIIIALGFMLSLCLSYDIKRKKS